MSSILAARPLEQKSGDRMTVLNMGVLHRWGLSTWQPVGDPRSPLPHSGGSGKNLDCGFTANQEMYRATMRPELYDDWHVDMVAEQRQARAVDGLLNYDCHWCKSTVLVTQESERCTDCNRPI